MNIVSFARAVPFQGVPHAGGAYLRTHLEVLTETNKVTLVVPGTKRNTEDKGKIDLPLDLMVIPPARSVLGKLRGKIIEEACPTVAPAYIISALKDNDELRSVVAGADIIEFQWSEYASLSRYVKKLNPGATLICICHDILRQKYRRRLHGAGSLKATLRSLLGFLSAVAWEKVNIRNMDRVIVFSAKDKALLGRALSERTVVVNPPIASRFLTGSRSGNEVLFTGALSRPENNEGICWFIKNCWEQIVGSVPGAILVIAGANPLPSLVELTAERADIRLTGYLEDLDVVYPTASVFVNPVLSGAGVKFKTISAMLYGVPVVSTTVGAEGIGSKDLYVQVTDDPTLFSDAVVTSLLDNASAKDLAESTRQWATGEYGLERFHDTLRSVYTDKKDAG